MTSRLQTRSSTLGLAYWIGPPLRRWASTLQDVKPIYQDHGPAVLVPEGGAGSGASCWPAFVAAEHAEAVLASTGVQHGS